MKDVKRLLAIAGVTLALAGCQTELNQSGDYKFELVGRPVILNGGTAVSVRLVHANESPVTGAALFAERWVYTGTKARPSELHRTPLRTDAQDNFTYASDSLHEGDTLKFAARIKPDGELIHGSVEVP